MILRYKSLISDVDWTLLNSEQFIFQAYLHTLKSFNLQPISLEQLLPQMGKPIEECYASFAPKIQDPKELIKTHREFQANHLALAIPYPHVIETLKLLKKGVLKLVQ